MNMKFVKFLDELSKNSLSEAGKKGTNLAEMYKIGLPIPHAFVVTVDAYKHFIEKTQIKEDKATERGDFKEMLGQIDQYIKLLVEKANNFEEDEGKTEDELEQLTV